MKSLKKISELADRFEIKLKKLAGEVGDTGKLSQTALPVVEAAIKTKGAELLKSTVLPVLLKSGLTGDVVLGGGNFTWSAVKQGGKWKVTAAKININYGPYANNAAVVAAGTSVTNKLVSMIAPVIAKKLDMLDMGGGLGDGDVITNHTVMVDETANIGLDP
jgi:hypothetical protein